MIKRKLKKKNQENSAGLTIKKYNNNKEHHSIKQQQYEGPARSGEKLIISGRKYSYCSDITRL